MTWFCRLCNWFSESFNGFCQTFFWQSVGHQHGGACEATYTMASWTTMSHPSTIFLLESGKKTPARNQTYKQTFEEKRWRVAKFWKDFLYVSRFPVNSLLFLVLPLFPRNLELPDLSFTFPSHGQIHLFILSFNLGFPKLSPRFSIFMAWNIKYFCHHPKRVWRFIKPEGKTEGGGGRGEGGRGRRVNKVRARGHHQRYG